MKISLIYSYRCHTSVLSLSPTFLPRLLPDPAMIRTDVQQMPSAEEHLRNSQCRRDDPHFQAQCLGTICGVSVCKSTDQGVVVKLSPHLKWARHAFIEHAADSLIAGSRAAALADPPLPALTQAACLSERGQWPSTKVVWKACWRASWIA